VHANEQCCNFADGATTWKREKSCESCLVLVSSGVWIGDWLIAGSHCPCLIAMSSTNPFKEHKRWCTWRWSSPSNRDFFVHQNLFYRPCFMRRIFWISWTSPVLITMLLVGMERCFSLGSVDGSDQDYELKNRNSNILQTITFDNVFAEGTLNNVVK